jgi:diaminopimelate decarboxylase
MRNITKLFNNKIDFTNQISQLFSEKIKDNRKKIEKILSDNKTPLYIYFKKSILKQLNKLDKSLDKNFPDYKIAYSFKTNYDVAQAGILDKQKISAEVVSEKEYKMAIKAGYKKSGIIYNGPNKSDLSLTWAIENNSLINLDNYPEFNKLNTITKKLPQKAKVGVRLNVIGDKSRFGFNINNGEASNVVQEILSNNNLALEGFHIHIGTNVDSVQNYQKATKKLVSFVKLIYKKNQFLPKILDLGGGFPTKGTKPYSRTKWKPKEISQYINVISNTLKKSYPTKKIPTIIIEPGRYLVNNSSFLVCKVLFKKEKNKQQTLTVDTTISSLPIKYYQPIIAKTYDKNFQLKQSRNILTIIYGASCRENDELYKGDLNSVKTGEYVAFYQLGAYNKNLSSNFIFDIPKSIFI